MEEDFLITLFPPLFFLLPLFFYNLKRLFDFPKPTVTIDN